MPRRGELEHRTLEVLWAAGGARSVADVLEELSRERELAYTTVMTVLDRLAKKQLVTRERVQRAWYYQPAEPRGMLAGRELTELFAPLEATDRAEALRVFSESLRAEDWGVLREQLASQLGTQEPPGDGS